MKTQLDAARPDALVLSEYLRRQAAYVQQHAPSLTDDIRHLQDAAALLDAYQAGLTFATPRAGLGVEVLIWTKAAEEMPAEGEYVLCFNSECPDAGVWEAYRYAGKWCAMGFLGLQTHVTDWAPAPTGPRPAPPIAARHDTEEAAA